MYRHPLAVARAVGGGRAGRPKNHRLPMGLRLSGEAPAAEVVQGELARDRPLAAVEAALFLADEPINARKLAALAGLVDAAEARRQVGRLRELYEKDGSAFSVEELAGGYQLLSRPEFHQWLARVRRQAAEAQLSPAARETLTIVAYRQPVTRADVEAIRGVGCNPILTQLMEKGLVKMAGRDDSLGRPALYETTKKFLQMYGLKSLKDLPPGEGLARKAEGP
jgi:segregation and condensation protein B